MESLKVEQEAVRVSQREAMMVARNSALLALKMKEEIQEPKTASEKQISPRQEHTPDNGLETQVKNLTTTAVDEKCVVWNNKFVILQQL